MTSSVTYSMILSFYFSSVSLAAPELGLLNKARISSSFGQAAICFSEFVLTLAATKLGLFWSNTLKFSVPLDWLGTSSE